MRATATVLSPLQWGVNFGRTVRLIWQSGPGWTMASVALQVGQGVLLCLSLYLFKRIVEAIEGSLAAADSAPAFAQVALLIGLAGVVALVSALLGSLATLVRDVQAQAITDHVQELLHAKSLEVDLEYYENAQYHDTLHRVQRHALDRPPRLLSSVLLIGQSGISLLAIAGVLLFSLQGSFAVILFVAALPGALVRWGYANKMYHWQHDRTPAERRVGYLHWLLTGDRYAKEIRLWGIGPLLMRQAQEVRTQLRQEKLRIITARSVWEWAAQASQILAIFGSFAFIAYRTVQGTHSLGDLMMYYQAFQRAQGVLQQLSSNLTRLYENSLFLSALYEFLRLTPKVVAPRTPQPVPRPMRSGIVFDHVSFQYPTGTKPVVEEVSLTIRPGDHVAFVGANGAGKTTLIKLLCRLYEPTQGRITFDGVDLREFDPTALWREIAVLFQDYGRYHHTARENIWFGHIDLPPEHARIVVAARHAGADEVLTGLKYGYETLLGTWFEEGEELSMGEWQKVALARAFLRDAQVIVLDEPTSALDAKAASALCKTFYQLTAGRTAILISHRLLTVRMADCIYVLEHGTIVESGTHDALVGRGGTYARLFGIQAQDSW